jgi:hypothetical protein
MTTYTGTLEAFDDDRIAIDARIGRPLAVTQDGRVLGSLGMSRGAAVLVGPDFASATQAFGGDIDLSSLDGSEIGVRYATVRRAAGHAIVRVGADTPGGCTL